MTWPAFVAAGLLSSTYGAAFHFLVGGSYRRLALYLCCGWLGFGLGHALGNSLGVRVWMLGPVNVLTGSLGSWVALIAARWLITPEGSDQP